MKKILIVSLTVLLSSPLIAQESDQQSTLQRSQTKMEQFMSKNGVLTKSEDFNTESIPLMFGMSAQTRIRKITSGGIVKLFYQIENEGKYGSKVGSVALEDFVELRKALALLKQQLVDDAASTADYLENRYITEDGLRVGYYLDKKKPTWFVRLEKYGSDNVIYLKTIDGLEASLATANDMFEKLK